MNRLSTNLICFLQGIQRSEIHPLRCPSKNEMTENREQKKPFLTIWFLNLLMLTMATGCASITNPVANGIPARLVPDELLAKPKDDLEMIPLTWLRRKPETVYKLASGDILGVYIEGVLGEMDQLPPIYEPQVADLPPSVGFPIPIRQTGTVPLPLVKPVKVAGMTLDEAEQAIVEAYTVDKQILNVDEARILVTLASPRHVEILVIREDTANRDAGITASSFFSRAASLLPQRGSGSGTVVRIPSTEADLLEVLGRSGGLPGPNAANEVIIQRGYGNRSGWPQDGQGDYCPPNWLPDVDKDADDTDRPVHIRIPFRQTPGSSPTFDSDDVILHDGDIVFVPAIDLQVYYTGGLLPSREVPLPRDYDLGVIEALVRIGGPFISGGFNTSNFQGGFGAQGLGNPSPSLLSILRRTPDGGQVNIRVNLNNAARDPRENLLIQAGDMLVLQETPSESVARYIGQAFSLSFLGEIFTRGDANAAIGLKVP